MTGQISGWPRDRAGRTPRGRCGGRFALRVRPSAYTGDLCVPEVGPSVCGRPRGQNRQCGLKGDRRGRRLTKRPTPPILAQKWPPGPPGRPSGRHSHVWLQTGLRDRRPWPPGPPCRPRGHSSQFWLKSGLRGRRADQEATTAKRGSKMASGAAGPATGQDLGRKENFGPQDPEGSLGLSFDKADASRVVVDARALDVLRV